jgi:glycosyltransferase involved in cell wall biosynthesis
MDVQCSSSKPRGGGDHVRLLVSIDEHYISGGTRIYSSQGTTPYKFFWSEYLQVFEQVFILARVKEDASFLCRQEAIANGPNVEFIALPDFKGPGQYLHVRKQVLECIREAIPKGDAYFLRGPGVIGGFLARELDSQGKRYVVQVIGDPWEVFGTGKVGGAMRPVYRQVLTRELKHICKKALGVSYVTRSTLQQRYPAPPAAFVSSWSDVQIGSGLASEEQLRARLQRHSNIASRKVRLGFVGSLEQPYKGADVLVRSVALCRARGIDVEAELAGDGRFRSQYEALAAEMGVTEHVKFLGRLPAGKSVFDFLDSIDFFVMPSLTEGLPRAMIEAMARGCPCIGSAVGGIPELLDKADLVKPGDPGVLAEKLIEKISSTEDPFVAMRRNHATARSFLPEHAQAIRFAFLSSVRNRFFLAKGTEFPRRGHVAMILTSALSAGFFRGQISQLRKAGYQVTLICSPGPQVAEIADEGAEFIAVPMEREISALKDLVSVWRLWWALRRVRPDITNVGTPKAGLLGGLAARIAGIPHRVYTLHGLRLETATGWKRRLLTFMERIACRNAHHVRCVSTSLRDRAMQLKLIREEQAYVIGAGSANGIDTAYFRRTPERLKEAEELRRQFNIPGWAQVIGFVGRFTRDKGIAELYRAFVQVKQTFPDARLLLVGDFEEGDPVDEAVRCDLESEPGVIFAGMVKDIPKYYAAMDVLALPTYREGFPNVPLEAQAACVPVVTTRVTGAVDSVLDGVTGTLIPPQDAEALVEALTNLLDNPNKRRSMGEAAACWVEDRFRRELIWEDLTADYDRMLNPKPKRVYQKWGKRAFDFALAGTALLVLSPLLALIALIVRLGMGTPIIFKQERPGLETRPFRLMKFRTMTSERNQRGELLPDSKRLTGLGRFLRKTSLDELPELINVLRGDMSLVGPRPLLMRYLPFFTSEEQARFDVRPGLTGLAQVSGRNALAWDLRLAKDVTYVQTVSLSTDLKIIFRSIGQVLRSSGVQTDPSASLKDLDDERRGTRVESAR